MKQIENPIVEDGVRWSVAMKDATAFHYGPPGSLCMLFYTRQEAREYCKRLNGNRSDWTPRRVRVTVEECND